MLFLQGTRDELADLDLMRGVCSALGSRATLHVVDGGDHSFKVLKRSGRDNETVMHEVRDAISGFMKRILGSAAKEPQT
jgi:predicted alpha/beta-hydrolase family hydrolase